MIITRLIQPTQKAARLISGLSVDETNKEAINDIYSKSFYFLLT